MAKLYTFDEMRQIINAKLEGIDQDSALNHFSIDSRTVKNGDIFFCIKGEITDGHHYISQALEKRLARLWLVQNQFRLNYKKKISQKF